MSIDLETLKHTAELARLNPAEGLTPEEAAKAMEELTEELATIVGYIDVLAEAETDGVEPMYWAMAEAPGPRPDSPRPGTGFEDILSQAPDRIGNFFAVPKIL